MAHEIRAFRFQQWTTTRIRRDVAQVPAAALAVVRLLQSGVVLACTRRWLSGCGRWHLTAMAVVLTVMTASRAYAAGHHQICYQGPHYNSLPTVVVQCRSDVPGVSCGISVPAARSGYYPPPAGASTVEAYAGSPGTTYTATIDFSDGTQRKCSTSLAGYYTSVGTAYTRMPGATAPLLTGYTTDESGLLMTGIWSSKTTGAQRVQSNTIGVPKDLVLVGGGALGTNYPSGALISKMSPTGDLEKREWRVQTQDAIYPQPHNNEAFAIGMKIEGLYVVELRNLVAWNFGGSNFAAHPTAQVTPIASYPAILGGGAEAFAQAYPQTGQFLTASSAIPAFYGFCWMGRCAESAGATGFFAESKDHGVSAPGYVGVWVSSMPQTIQVYTAAGPRNFRVETFGRGVASSVAAHPSIVVAGRSGEFALTGVGAVVDWRSYGYYGNLLWMVVPRADIAGVEAASKDHAYSSPAVIAGYALGVKLVP
jgi:hypothetical protein